MSVVCLALFGLVHLIYDVVVLKERPQPSDGSCYCGKSVEEAKTRKCTFDPIAAAWLPPACIDAELMEEFNHAGPGPNGSWQYWSDFNRTMEYSLEEVAILPDVNGKFYVTHDWHIKHCTYNWRKQYRSRMTRVHLDARSGGYGHIGHCEGILRQRWGLHDVTTSSAVSLNADHVPGHGY